MKNLLSKSRFVFAVLPLLGRVEAMQINSTLHSRVFTIVKGFNYRLTIERVSWTEPKTQPK